MRVTIEHEYYADRFKVTSKNGIFYIRASEISIEAYRVLDSASEDPRRVKRALKKVGKVRRREERLTAKIEKGRARLGKWRERELAKA